MRCGSLFSGVGLFELGLVWSGLVSEVAWQVEIDPWCRSVLAARYPGADRSVSDVSLAGSANLAPVDVICGGFPCQDVSGAGLGAGLDGARSGLWYEYLRILGELRPPLAIVENVASGKGRWLCAVRSGLHALGYRTRAVQISAADVGLPHRRERVFVVAYADGTELRLESRWSGGAHGPGAAESGRGGEALAYAERQGQPQPGGAVSDERGRAEHGGQRGALAYARGAGLEERFGLAGDAGAQFQAAKRGGETGAARPALPLLGRGPHGLPDRVDRAPAGRGAEQHDWEPPRTVERAPSIKPGGARPFARLRDRQARLKALGNGIVPQCAEAVGRFVIGEVLA